MIRRLFSHCGFRDVLKAHWPLLTLMTAMLVIVFLQWLVGRPGYLPFMMVPVDVVESWGHLKSWNLTGEDFRVFSTMLSSGFLHGDLMHWGSNMIFMWMFGSLLSGLVRNRTMLLIFLVTTFAGGACDAYLRASEFIPSLGASGGVMGLEGAYLGMALRFRLPDPHTWPLARPVSPGHLVIFAMIGVAFDFSGLWQGIGNTAYGAHIGGFLAGVLLTGFLLPLRQVKYPRR